MRLGVAGSYSTDVSWGGATGEVHCMLVQRQSGQTAARIAKLMTTGRPVEIPAHAQQRLDDLASTMRMTRHRRNLRFVSLCLEIGAEPG